MMIPFYGDLDPESTFIVQRFAYLQQETLKLMIDRQRKYGPHNISAAGFDGVLVRLGDKLARLKRGTADHADESAKDTLYDVANYALIAVMVLEGSWPKPPQKTKEEEAQELLATLNETQARLARLGVSVEIGVIDVRREL